MKRIKNKICSKVKRGGWVTKYKVREEGGESGKIKVVTQRLALRE